MTFNMPTRWIASGFASCAAFGVASSALAAPACPGNPDALGTSRTLVVDPRQHPLIGTMQYAETLPLADKEVVLTFDDGPIPKYSDQILDILAAECIKATFFVVGMMAKEHPDGVRRMRDADHTIGTHTQHHPLGMKRMGAAAAQAEIDGGIAATTAALGGPPAPFFRIPGLSRAEATEKHAAGKGLQVWSADFPADDWRHVTPETVHALAMSRIEAKGRGILLLHDIQPRTVAALPAILRDLKAKGYRIVHVVPARKDLPATPTDPAQWRMPSSVAVAAQSSPSPIPSPWPAVPGFAFARSDMLPNPAMTQTGLSDGGLLLLPEPFNRVKRLARGDEAPADQARFQSHASSAVPLTDSAALPIPGLALFAVPERMQMPMTAAQRLDSRPVATRLPRVAQPADASAARQRIPGSMPVTRPGLHRIGSN